MLWQLAKQWWGKHWRIRIIYCLHYTCMLKIEMKYSVFIAICIYDIDLCTANMTEKCIFWEFTLWMYRSRPTNYFELNIRQSSAIEPGMAEVFSTAERIIAQQMCVTMYETDSMGLCEPSSEWQTFVKSTSMPLHKYFQWYSMTIWHENFCLWCHLWYFSSHSVQSLKLLYSTWKNDRTSRPRHLHEQISVAIHGVPLNWMLSDWRLFVAA